MGIHRSLAFLLFNFILINGKMDTKHYIVYMGEHSYSNSEALISDNEAILEDITGRSSEAIQHYSQTFRGFSAMLTQEQAAQLKDHEEVVSVFESKMSKLHTTHSWDFLGVHLNSNLGLASKLGSDVIIGSIDTGIWPESKSFNDEGFGPVPNRFKGECIPGQNFTKSHCNRKIIGARYYSKGIEATNGSLESFSLPFFRSARDADGHGSHTASTAVGAVVPHTSMYGLVAGTARGGAPAARIAVYKACWFGYCDGSDLLSAFDQAAFDGVDIISLSVGYTPPQTSYFTDPIAIGSFHAFRKGVLVSASAGNAGGGDSTTMNIAPWMLTVAASSMDRRMDAYVRLGNGQLLRGASLNEWDLESSHPIIEGKAAAAHHATRSNASYCHKHSLDRKKVAGKVVVCFVDPRKGDFSVDKAYVVRRAHGAGVILAYPHPMGIARDYAVPSVVIGDVETRLLYDYLSSERNPVASITKARVTMGRRIVAPDVASFSSRGPNTITPDIIKPDITAPGLNILAAWSPIATDDTAGIPQDYIILSGTSMAAPHISAAAAVVKSHHPGWSPSTIMSALMTTATQRNSRNEPILRYHNDSIPTVATPLDYGSGHLNPFQAMNPGLVYGFTSDAIIDFLCGYGASLAGMKNLTGNAIKCKTAASTMASYDLNYPSIGVGEMKGVMTVRRTVKSVQDGHRVYDVLVESPEGVVVTVVPTRLEFFRYGEKNDFMLHMVPKKVSNGRFVFGSITWSDGEHRVRSPLGVNVVSI